MKTLAGLYSVWDNLNLLKAQGMIMGDNGITMDQSKWIRGDSGYSLEAFHGAQWRKGEWGGVFEIYVMQPIKAGG